MLKPEEIRLRHRDLNWLSFNERVLQEAEDTSNPLYERIKFLAIFSTNLDEYFQVRVSQLRQMKRVQKSIRKKLSLKPNKTVKEILGIVKEQQQRFGEIYYKKILPELEKNNIFLIGYQHFTKNQQNFATSFFEKVSKHINPILVDLEHQSNLFLKNNQLYMLVTFKDEKKYGFVNIPVEECGRFISLKSTEKEHKITFLDDIIKHQVPEIFPDQEIKGIYEIKVSRDAELYIDDDVEGILAEKIYESLKQRTDGQPTRLLYDANMPAEVQKKLRKLLSLGKIDMMPGGEYHNFGDFFSLPDPTKNPDLHYKNSPLIKHNVLEKAQDYFEEISKKDQAVHFPYMSFNYVEEFLKQAATDEQVEEIKISIYRIADESEITSTLVTALENKKR